MGSSAYRVVLVLLTKPQVHRLRHGVVRLVLRSQLTYSIQAIEDLTKLKVLWRTLGRVYAFPCVRRAIFLAMPKQGQ